MSDIKTATPRKFADRSIVQLTLVRFREFTRQPEAVFWTFVFPILLAVGLGLAFRSKVPERPRVGVIAGQPVAQQVIADRVVTQRQAGEMLDQQRVRQPVLVGRLRTAKDSIEGFGVRFFDAPRGSADFPVFPTVT